ncbi:MAG: hypothetical protein AAGJ35_05990, partial [Myxococcota bacterium]
EFVEEECAHLHRIHAHQPLVWNPAWERRRIDVEKCVSTSKRTLSIVVLAIKLATMDSIVLKEDVCVLRV